MIAVSVVAENAGHGGSVAAPVAGAVMRYYFAHNPEGMKVAQGYAEADSLRKKNYKQQSPKPEDE
jgi:L-serine deaminase